MEAFIIIFRKYFKLIDTLAAEHNKTKGEE